MSQKSKPFEAVCLISGVGLRKQMAFTGSGGRRDLTQSLLPQQVLDLHYMDITRVSGEN